MRRREGSLHAALAGVLARVRIWISPRDARRCGALPDVSNSGPLSTVRSGLAVSVLVALVGGFATVVLGAGHPVTAPLIPR